MIRKLRTIIPELYLIGATLYYWSLTALVINWVAITLLAFLIFLVISKNKIIGMIFAILLILINLYLILALLSEFNEFPEFNYKAKLLLVVGSLFIGLNLLFASMMLAKFSKKPIKKFDNKTNILDA